MCSSLKEDGVLACADSESLHIDDNSQFCIQHLIPKVASEALYWTVCHILMLLEEWVKSILQARKAVELLESRNGFYVLYMDRVTGLLAEQVGQVSSLHKLNPDLLDKLFL
ncbi:hypothetical protein Pint_14355 [Pistacia integerrima]|uniref:Uncharacterized protein n=2 Tax=Pistacia integerrima TaxID=434235 RepID=A0ACC0Y7K2_9ROSI|nr:hypothetical protein Pint_14358 [Pistacia integerrima]KAJ0031079.1 hypothetical protein Pint_14355 [Pistacia integerrima]